MNEVAPAFSLGQIESCLIEACEDILVLKGLTAGDDLLRLGGDSLVVVRILLSLEARLGVTLDDDVYTGGGRIGQIAQAIFNQLNAA